MKSLSIEEAKTISIAGFLSRMNIKPQNVRNNKAFYRSSLGRESKERTASLIVDLKKNTFVDYGIGQSGDIINLVSIMNSINTKGALEILSQLEPTIKPFTFAKEETVEKPLIIHQTKAIEHSLLTDYLQKRCIDIAIARRYCHEIQYSFGEGRKYIAIGFKNDAGGWELRNELFKGGNKPKTITTNPGNPHGLNIFEGFFDFLSCLTYHRTLRLNFTTIVLNSVHNFHKIEPLIPIYNVINLFLDNDQQGSKLARKISTLNPHTRNVSLELYFDYKDFNEFLKTTIRMKE